MKHSTTKAIFLTAALTLGFAGREALAGPGVVIDSSRLPEQARASLKRCIAKVRASHPEAFDRVAAAPAMAASFDRTKRGPLASITLPLKALGREALFPMLNMVAVEGPNRGELSDTAWLALRVSLLEAIGILRDRRAEPVLEAILDGGPPEYEIDRAAAQALARIGSDEAAGKLIAMARAPGPKRLAALTGIGDCRRAAVAEALANLLARHPAPEVAGVIARSLGDVGNSWAWRTAVVAASGEEEATRATAARALVSAFAVYDGQARRLIGKAVLVVDHPSTPALIEAARAGAPADAAAELDRLAERFARNPIRR
ncbi:MAG: HEAT repeat domain-containing protein [Deltaproteobacteria bacterium]|nr:HEAT repeat domain-containing protein [Deltaproteobacteria bacterium]